MRTHKTAVAAAALLLTLALGPASALALGTPTASIVSGTAWRLAPAPESTPRVEFRVGANIGPAKALGTYEFANTAGTTLAGPVTCGDVDSNVGVIGGTITSSNEPGLIGLDYLVFFVDNGAPTFGSIGPDIVSTTDVGEPHLAGSDFPGDFPAHCPEARGDTFDLFVSSGEMRDVLGNIVVR